MHIIGLQNDFANHDEACKDGCLDAVNVVSFNDVASTCVYSCWNRANVKIHSCSSMMFRVATNSDQLSVYAANVKTVLEASSARYWHLPD